METPLTIDITNGGKYYALFYFSAFLAGLVILVWEGRKRKFPTIPWLLVVATTFLFFMIGTQAIKFTSDDWSSVLRYQLITHNSGRSVLGGILFSIPALLIAKYALKFRYDLMDVFAWATPIGMIVQRFGCLLASCCFGTITDVPWGVRYGISSHVFDHHVNHHVIDASNTLSLPVHPVPLYEVTGCIFILLLLLLIRKSIKVHGNLFIASLGLYSIVRFCTEFFRATSFGADQTSDFTTVQLVILFVTPLILFIIIFREKKWHSKVSASATYYFSEKQSLIYFLVLAIVFLLASRWLSMLEILTLNLIMIPTLALMGWQVFKSVTVPHMRLTTLGLFVGSILLMSQTLPETASTDSTRVSYNIFSFGMMTGNSDFVIQSEDCNGNVYTNNHTSNTFKAYGAGLGRVQQQKKGTLQYGLDGYWGYHREVTSNVQTQDISILGFHPYFQYDWKIVGLGVGLHAGVLSQFIPEEDYTNANLPTTVKEMNIYPSAYFRVGYLSKFFGEIKIAQQFPSPFPSVGFQTNLGIGFDNTKGAAVRFGTASYAGLFLAPTIPIGKHIIFEPYVAGLQGILPAFYEVDGTDYQENSFMGSLSIRYKFARKKSF